MCCSASGVIHVSYAYVKRPQDSLQEPPEVFHTRQLSYPVLVTVYHMLECHAMDILPYSGATTVMPPSAHNDEPTEARERRSLLHVGDIADWCIFSIEVRNTYGLPFEVTFERTQEGECMLRLMAVLSSLTVHTQAWQQYQPQLLSLLVQPLGAWSDYMYLQVFH